jgi:glycerol-3-phosphate acyltransferase PlsY
MVRPFGWGMGSLTFLGDLAKGALSALICSWIGGDWCVFVGGLFCILGHVWPIQYGFRGGKGVAATFGVMLAVNPLVAVITFAACFLVALVTRFVSIASLLG